MHDPLESPAAIHRVRHMVLFSSLSREALGNRFPSLCSCLFTHTATPAALPPQVGVTTRLQRASRQRKVRPSKLPNNTLPCRRQGSPEGFTAGRTPRGVLALPGSQPSSSPQGQRPMHSSVSTQKTGPGSDGDLGSHENAGLDFCPCVLLAFYVTTRFVILLDPGAHIMHLKEKKYPVSERGPN